MDKLHILYNDDYTGWFHYGSKYWMQYKTEDLIKNPAYISKLVEVLERVFIDNHEKILNEIKMVLNYLPVECSTKALDKLPIKYRREITIGYNDGKFYFCHPYEINKKY